MSRKKSGLRFSQLWSYVDFKKTSTITLIFSNVLVIFFTIIGEITAMEVLWIYWFQSVIIGMFTFGKIITLKDFSTAKFKVGNKQPKPTRAAAIFIGLFFFFHYGLFHLVYAVFLGLFTANSNLPINSNSYIFILISAGIFFINYLVDYIKSKKNESAEIPNIGKIMSAPYARIIPMHLTIIFGGFIGAVGQTFSADTNIAIVVLFTTIKTIVDLITHSVDFSMSTPAKAVAE
ncbi:MAG: DUF6498-containing protein [Ignavibacteriaceae bacterium]|jgi:hypothetical protein|nr:DUF6498-containing protein [Ignavibacteriaceae bacterium]